MKRILSVLLALSLCLCLFACGKKPAEPPVQPTEPSVPVSTCPTAPTQPATEPPTEVPTQPEGPAVPEVILGSATVIFKDDSDHPVLQVDVTLPACESLPQIDGYYKAMYDDLTATYGLNQEDAALRRSELVSQELDFTPWAVTVKADVTRNDGVTLSVVREVYEHFGGPYPTVSFRAETFDVATQGRLLLSDLFQPGADYLSRLPVAEPDQLNVALTDDSLVLCAGEEKISLPLSDLSDILLPQYLAE